MGRPWSDVDCPYEVLQVFGTVPAGQEQVHQELQQVAGRTIAAAATTADTAGISGEGRRERDHSIDCNAMSRRAPIQMVEWLGGSCGWTQDIPDCSRHSRVAWP